MCKVCIVLMVFRAPDRVRIFIYIMPISSPNPMFDHLLESSHRDDSNKWSNIGFGEEITQVESIEVNKTTLIWSSALYPMTAKVLLVWLNPIINIYDLSKSCCI